MKHAPRSRVWSAAPSAFTGFRFPAEVIVVAVRWYLRRAHYELGVDAQPALRIAELARAI